MNRSGGLQEAAALLVSGLTPEHKALGSRSRSLPGSIWPRRCCCSGLWGSSGAIRRWPVKRPWRRD